MCLDVIYYDCIIYKNCNIYVRYLYLRFKNTYHAGRQINRMVLVRLCIIVLRTIKIVLVIIAIYLIGIEKRPMRVLKWIQNISLWLHWNASYLNQTLHCLVEWNAFIFRTLRYGYMVFFLRDVLPKLSLFYKMSCGTCFKFQNRKQ